MSRRGKIILMVLLGGVAGMLLLGWGRREPRYQERTLTSWLEQCYKTPLMETQRLAEAQSAVRAIGAEKALPYLLKYAGAEDGPARRWMIKQSGKWEELGFKLKKDEDIQQLGIAGFEVLETNAAPAVPELTRLLNDPKHAFTAVRCLIFIGVPAKTPIRQALTNSDWRVRHFSAQQLGWVIDDVEDYFTEIKGCLKDTDGNVRFAAVGGIGMQTEDPDLAIPLLVTALQDQNDSVSSQAASLLGEFGTNSLRAVGALSNSVVNGRSATAGAALRTLVKIAPKETLPMVMVNFSSLDVGRRRQAFGVLCQYPLQSPEIQAAIERAATDPDDMLSRRAKKYITDQKRELRKGQPLIADEPSHGGKRLGEWLKEHEESEGRRDSHAFTKEAEEALRQMGTNAIPALLQRLVYVEPPYGLPAREVNLEAAKAFMTMRELARPARSQLMSSMDSENPDIALYAMISTLGMGADAFPCMLKGLTNQHELVRSEAMNFLGQSEDAEIKSRRKEALPLILKLLEDPKEMVRMNATNAFVEIDPEGARKAGVSLPNGK